MVNAMKRIQKRAHAAALALMVTTCPIAASSATAWSISQIVRGGAEVETADLQIQRPGASAAGAVSVRRRDTLAVGTTLRVPPGTRLQLESPNGQLISSHDLGSAIKLGSVSARGESYDVQSGSWFFQVRRQLDFFNVQVRSISAQTRGTTFSATVDEAAGGARYEVQEGRIQIRYPALARIGDAGSTDLQTQVLASETMSAGEPAKTFAFTPERYLLQFGNYGEAADYFERRLAAAEQASDVGARVDMLIALGDVHVLLGEPEKALVAYTRALELMQAMSEGYWQAVLLGRLGAAHQGQGNFGQAIAYYKQSVQLHGQQASREGEFPVAEQGANLAAAVLADGTYRCARLFGEKVLARLAALYAGRNHPAFAQLQGVIGGAAHGLRNYEEAAVAHQTALDIQKRLRFATQRADGLTYHEDVVDALNALGRDLSALRRLDRAQDLHQQAFTISQTLFPGPHARQADARHGLALVSTGRGRHTEALAEHQRALALLERAPRDVLRLGVAHYYIAEGQIAEGRPQDAVNSLLRASGLLREKITDEVHPSFVGVYTSLAAAYDRWVGHAGDAAAARARAQDIVQRVQAREAACLQ